MAYTEIPDADVAVDAFGKTTSVFQRLRDNIRAIRQQLLAWCYAEDTNSTTSYVTVDALRIYIPNVTTYTGIARSIVHEFTARVSGGTGTWRLRDDASTDTGDEVTSTETGAGGETKEADIDVDAGWIGTIRTIQIQSKATAAESAYTKSNNAVTTRVIY